MDDSAPSLRPKLPSIPSIMKDFDEILCIENQLKKSIYKKLIETCKANPRTNITIEKSILQDLLRERALLLESVRGIRRDNPESTPALVNSAKKKEKKNRRKPAGSLGLRKKHFTAKIDSKDAQYFTENTAPQFVEKINFDQLPSWPIRRSPVSIVVTTMRGPGDSTLDVQSFDYIASARVISNYPKIPGRPFREGDPICDRFLVKIYEDQTVIALADGCNWGHMPRKAAKRATKKLVETVEEHYLDMTNTKIAARVLVMGFSRAQDRIEESAEDELGPGPGKTTLVGGILVPNPMNGREWFFIFVSLGDCKFFHYSPGNDSVKDLTYGNRMNISDASDPGGRLGGSSINLGNFDASVAKIKDGDYIIAMSDGVHDNFDPQSLGITPSELDMEEQRWEDVKDVKRGHEVKTKYMEQELLNVINSLDVKNTENIVIALTEKSKELTQDSRTFMEKHPKEKLPDDVKAYPGKLDHASCVCVMAGAKPLAFNDLIGNTFDDSEEVRLHEALREQQLSCHSLDVQNAMGIKRNKRSAVAFGSATWKSTSAPINGRRASFLGPQ